MSLHIDTRNSWYAEGDSEREGGEGGEREKGRRKTEEEREREGQTDRERERGERVGKTKYRAGEKAL